MVVAPGPGITPRRSFFSSVIGIPTFLTICRQREEDVEGIEAPPMASSYYSAF
jgi:hypothetical protein